MSSPLRNLAETQTRLRAAPVVSPDQIISQPTVIATVLALDAAVIIGTGLAASEVAVEPLHSPLQLALVLSAVALLAILIIRKRWGYTIPALLRPLRQTANCALALFLALAALLVACVIVDTPIAPVRDFAGYWLLSSWLGCTLVRVGASLVLSTWRKAGRLARRTVIVGGGDAAETLIARLDRSAGDAVQILGLFDDRDKERSPERIGAYVKLGRFDDLVSFCREQRVDLLIIALPLTAEARILQLLKMLWVLPVDVRISALSSQLKLRGRAYNYVGDVPLLPLFDKPMSDVAVAMKVIEDRVISALALIVLSPLLALIALAVKLDSRGPVFFRQVRYGFNNERIDVYKFRSMYVDMGDASGVKQATRDDPRVTRVGRFLRRSSLDELPQLLNVLCGELSLVGPRPHALQAAANGQIYDQVVEGYFARHKVKPGITGWAQISGWRGETDTVEKIEQRVAHDLFYIENWSLMFDLRILLQTPLSLVTTKNAY
ncbi:MULTISPECIES: undecaprenyl-phosphate glucose phosphotransferase [unclassified Beijerinckia]|uniref:undecaprenyl-phosphate glucose phosphotransferase n=1 Tax=unclassified Beijerinckia TaxID=2638183 RepID=UPI00089D8FA5|nr:MULTISPECIES: undecaprenyl-phosphate glucose phosphotransferase [unclassified Beijerinckia]MDH7795642.1 Undecaprenyl-phosphate glucose phosphotransferase [Beijerinckia sp. GAS462]SEC09931.1 Undecaprenyl-phosphate glucose phosphotransferase [Beijerinckia sp. 28-YEA-48]